MDAMRKFRRTIVPGEYPPIAEIKERPSEDYSKGYLGPLNPFWDETKTRLEMAERWQGLERRRKPQFKQPLQDYEHSSANNLLEFISDQIRENLKVNEFRSKNPTAPIRVMLFDLPMTHYGHIEKPRQLAGGIVAALKWLYDIQ